MSGIEVGDEALGQCEARHWLFGRCHYVPHPPGTDHWIEHPAGSGRGASFTDAATSTSRPIICENVTPTPNGDR